MSKGRTPRLAFVAAVTAFFMAFAGIALADQMQVDNDVAGPGNQNIVSFTVAPGATVNTSGQMTIQYQGNQHLPDGAALAFSVSAQQTTLPSGYSVSTVNGTVPSDWSSSSTGRQVALGTSNVSFTAPSTAGDYQYAVKWTASGPSCLDNNPTCLTGSNDLTVNVKVEEQQQTCTYTATFRAPLDQSSPANFVGNTFKKGRVLPVKANVYCNGVEITPSNSSLVPSIALGSTSFVPKATDAVETFSDAGSSAGGTTDMRWSTDGFWLYNYDSSKLLAGSSHKISIQIDGQTITNTFVLLNPTK